MGSWLLGLEEVDRAHVARVGGKGAQLGELSRIEGIRVPPGFCVTTEAFDEVLALAPSIGAELAQLFLVKAGDREAIRTITAGIRRSIEEVPIPEALAAEVTLRLKGGAWAVRSSATAEDLPTASFAGQHDTSLNVVGAAAVLQQLSRCWASLFTERAVSYRLHHGFDHRRVRMAVVVQQMLFPHAAGVMFTADPVTSNRNVASVEAVFGLGEALVSGLVNTDAYKVRDGVVVSKSIATERQKQPALTDAQVVQLVQLGRRLEAYFGAPQDLEWCLVDGSFQFVQSRPITTLFPIPVATDAENHVYISVGHQQMMTDAMKPLGLSVFKLVASAPMVDAGGRLFVDVTRHLASPASRAGLLQLAKSDPLIGDALRNIVERGDFIRPVEDAGPSGPTPPAAPIPLEADVAIVTELMANAQASIAALKLAIRAKSGAALMDFILTDIQELKRILFDRRGYQVFMTAIDASAWLNDKLEQWLGEKNAADTLTQSVDHNVTSEMGLALLDVADVVRPHREVVAFLERVSDDGFLSELPRLEGGQEARAAIDAWLETYGMRCVGEIDITRPRWVERPSTLVPLILANVRNLDAGAGPRRFERGRREAASKEQELLERLRALADGEQKAIETRRMIDRVRTFIGYREYPKYGMVSRTLVYRRALLEEAGRQVQAGVLREVEDIGFLTFQELHEVVRSGQVNGALIGRRKDAFRAHQALTPPRVLTSEGEAVAGSYRRSDFPAGALVGLAVSAGTIEGRARVIANLADATLEPGDILVTPFTDPSWTPLFVAIKGLVTEVGGLMTHGAVIAREYGLPAVVGVEHATRRIRDGQRIRVNGTDGYVELLP